MSTTNLDERTLGELRVEWKTSIAQQGRRPVSWQDLDVLLEDMLKDRLKLERRIKELESRPMPTYRGVHKDGDSYKANSMTTRGGSLWFATEHTTSTPGTDGAWRLIVKRGEAK